MINLENKGYDETSGAASPAPYLNKTLRPKGQLLTQYFAIGHASLDNYIAQISGQGPNSADPGRLHDVQRVRRARASASSARRSARAACTRRR